MKTINTSEKTFNKSVKSQVLTVVTGAAKFIKKHVAGIGYVFYIKNSSGINLAFVSRVKGQMVITIQ